MTTPVSGQRTASVHHANHSNINQPAVPGKRGLASITGNISQQIAPRQYHRIDIRQPSTSEQSRLLEKKFASQPCGPTSKIREDWKNNIEPLMELIQHDLQLTKDELLETANSLFDICKEQSMNGKLLDTLRNGGWSCLRNDGFTLDQIFTITASASRNYKLDKIIQNAHFLKTQNFQCTEICLLLAKEISRISSGGARLQAAADLYAEIKSRGFNQQQILTILANKHENIRPSLHSLNKNFELLIQSGFNHAQICLVAAGCRSSTSLQVLAQKSHTLISIGFDHQQIANIIVKAGFGQNLIDKLSDDADRIKKLSSDQKLNLINICVKKGEKTVYRALNQALASISVDLTPNLNTDKTANITVNDNPSATQHADYILGKYFLSDEQIATIKDNCDTSQIEDVINNMINLTPYLDFDEQIIDIIANGSAPALQKAVDATAFLKEHGFSTNQITDLLTDGGLAALQDQVDQITLMANNIADIDFTTQQIDTIATNDRNIADRAAPVLLHHEDHINLMEDDLTEIELTSTEIAAITEIGRDLFGSDQVTLSFDDFVRDDFDIKDSFATTLF